MERHGYTRMHRSQIGRINALAEPTIWEGTCAKCHVISHASLTNKRVCSSTMQAESHAMIAATDLGDRLRAMIASMRGQLDMLDWEKSAKKAVKHLWLSDCESLVSHLQNPKDEKLTNTRLSIDIAGLKQILWIKDDGAQFEGLPEVKGGRHINQVD